MTRTKHKIASLEERIGQLESERGNLSWESWPTDTGSVFSCSLFLRRNKLTGSEILTRLNEIYDYLGVTRETSPQLTKLKKKNAS